MPKAPDLQELVQRFGTYSNITPEAWEQYDRQMAEWHHARRIETCGQTAVAAIAIQKKQGNRK
jgi:hypothetical protein